MPQATYYNMSNELGEAIEGLLRSQPQGGWEEGLCKRALRGEEHAKTACRYLLGQALSAEHLYRSVYTLGGYLEAALGQADYAQIGLRESWAGACRMPGYEIYTSPGEDVLLKAGAAVQAAGLRLQGTTILRP